MHVYLIVFTVNYFPFIDTVKQTTSTSKTMSLTRTHSRGPTDETWWWRDAGEPERERSSFLNPRSAGTLEGPRIDVGPLVQLQTLMSKSGFWKQITFREKIRTSSAQKTLEYSHEPSHPRTGTCNPWSLLEFYHDNPTGTLWVSNGVKKHWYLVIMLIYTRIYHTFLGGGYNT